MSPARKTQKIAVPPVQIGQRSNILPVSGVPEKARRARSSEEFHKQIDLLRRRRGLFSRFTIVRRDLPRIAEVNMNDLPRRNVLVLAPHPEEPVEKCFATIKGFLNAGSNVKVHVLTTGAHGVELPPEKVASIQATTKDPVLMERLSKIKTRLKELRAADKLLGVRSKVHSLPFYDSQTVTNRDYALMKEIIGSGKWDVVIMPDRLDLQPTHATIYDLAVRYLRRQAVRRQKPIELWGFETTYHRHPLSELNQIVYYSGEVQDSKMKAMKAHASQDARRGAYILGRMAEAERSSALAEEKSGFGSHVDFQNAQRLEAFSVNQIKPWGPFSTLSKRK
jgi:LmbE family N-acetylglucosaminyl deacetylase